MIRVKAVTKEFPPDVVAVDSVDLTVEDGEFAVLVGPSGCGKSTLLALVAGLESPTAGSIEIDGEDVTSLAPQDRDVAMIFQNYALYPQMTAGENIAFPLQMRRLGRQAIRAKVLEVARTLELEPLLERYPAELSGGQRQRVAMGRAIVRQPRAFLMDEPLSNLDSALRVQMRAELIRLRKAVDTTTVYVTHDQVEAMTLGDRVAVIDRGVLQQHASPTELYERPANLFVARFVGSPAMNTINGRMERGMVRVLGLTLPAPATRSGIASEVIVGIRPPSFEADEFCSSSSWPRLDAQVDVVEALGSETLVYFTPADGASSVMPIRATAAGEPRSASLAARIDPRARVEPGGRMRLALDPASLHLFDSETEQAL